jgi:hypothetical protein
LEQKLLRPKNNKKIFWVIWPFPWAPETKNMMSHVSDSVGLTHRSETCTYLYFFIILSFNYPSVVPRSVDTE